MFSNNNYVVFMITMRIGKQGIPLWFRCFKYDDFSLASRESLLMEGISYVSSLFDKSYNLIFLADRWFNSVSLMKHIDNLGHIFRIRVKRNIKVLIYDKKEKHDIWKFLKTIKPYKYHSSWYENVGFTDENFIVNLAISQRAELMIPRLLLLMAMLSVLLRIMVIVLVPLNLSLKIKNLMVFI